MTQEERSNISQALELFLNEDLDRILISILLTEEEK